jgi:GntR family transcriptional regulator, transcriptional repressor for pyruvate dehydrogenase complex
MSLSPTYTSTSAEHGRRLHDDVVLQILRQILHGRLKPGEALPTEPVLVQQFGVSRTVIREAIRVLAAKGLLSVKHGSGMWVQPSENWDYLDPTILFEHVRAGRDVTLLHELIEVRRLLEPEAAALAAERRTSEDLTALRDHIAGMAAFLTQPDLYTRLDIEFHSCLLAAAQNRLLREALRSVALTLSAGRLLSIQQPGAAEQSLRGHEEIFAAVAEQDSDAARAAMRRHILQFEQDLLATISEGKGAAVDI